MISLQSHYTGYIHIYGITKATSIHFINGKCDIKFNQSHRVYIYHTLVISSLGDGHTHAHTQIHKHRQKNQACIWFSISFTECTLFTDLLPEFDILVFTELLARSTSDCTGFSCRLHWGLMLALDKGPG